MGGIRPSFTELTTGMVFKVTGADLRDPLAIETIYTSSMFIAGMVAPRSSACPTS